MAAPDLKNPRHPLLAMWCHPRSMSTATERIMRERGDFHCFHEPFIHHYYLERTTRSLALYEVPSGVPVTFAEVQQTLLRSAHDGPTFLKDMAYYVTPQICDDDAFLERVDHMFLVRDPRKAILSFYRLDPDFPSSELGVVAQLELARAVEQRKGEFPSVMRAEDIQQNPRGVLNTVWRRVGIEPNDNSFGWSPDETPGDWRHVAGWHERAIDSTGIRAPTAADDPAAVQDQFDGLCKEVPRLQDMYHEHLPAYEALCSHAVVPDVEPR